MNQLYRITYLLIVLVLCSKMSLGDEFGQIMRTGEFHGDEISAADGEEWYVLYSKDNKFFLEKTNIKLKMVEDVILDERGEKTGKEVSVNLDGDPVLLLKNFPDLTSGEIETSHNQKIYFFEQNSFDIKIGKNEYQLKMNILDSKAELILTDGSLTQNLKEFFTYKADDSINIFGDDAMPSLIWAGDLDKDNKPDFLLDMTSHYNVSEITLFLSSHASKDELVGKAAVFRTVGC